MLRRPVTGRQATRYADGVLTRYPARTEGAEVSVASHFAMDCKSHKQDRDVSHVRLRFVHAAEYVRVGTPLIFRDGGGGGASEPLLGLMVGVVTRLSSAESSDGWSDAKSRR